ncbi:GNAT family N-acetyltransferase [bacterium]|nr:GNAT family N-acetyltransferase [bacterium]
MEIKLVRLSKEYKNQLFEMMDEWTHFKGDKDDKTPYAIFKNDYHDFDNYLENLEIKHFDGKYVPDSVFFALDTKRNIFIGAVNIRHFLSEHLLKKGGHIGDGIRPSERRKGFGTEMIRLALIECKNLGINKVLMICDKENIASKKTIIKNGGILEYIDGDIERYWINISN